MVWTPSMAKQLERQLGQQVAANTFQLVAQEWLERVHQHDVVPDHYQRNRRRLERDAFPVLGKDCFQRLRQLNY